MNMFAYFRLSRLIGWTFPFSSTVARGLNALSRMGSTGVVVALGFVDAVGLVAAFGAVDPDVTAAAGLSIGATTGADVLAGATAVDSPVAVSAGVAPLSPVVQATATPSVNTAIPCPMFFFIVFRFG